VLLLITGKPPAGHGRQAVGPAVRGAIRAAVGDWLAASRHAGDIAAVRNAHPRHGGAGALYIVLRRRKG
jgi:DNA-nicking Smr family endonuclease